jgi:hypothetical protein
MNSFSSFLVAWRNHCNIPIVLPTYSHKHKSHIFSLCNVLSFSFNSAFIGQSTCRKILFLDTHVLIICVFVYGLLTRFCTSSDCRTYNFELISNKIGKNVRKRGDSIYMNVLLWNLSRRTDRKTETNNHQASLSPERYLDPLQTEYKSRVSNLEGIVLL